MTETADRETSAPVVRTVHVRCGPDLNVSLFTDRIADWWPLQRFGLFEVETAGVWFEGDRVVERPPGVRTCPLPCPAVGPGSSTAAAAPTAFSRSVAIWSAVAPLAPPARSRASTGRRPLSSQHRTRSARRSGTSSNRAGSVRTLRTVPLSDGLRHLVGLARRDPIVSRAHAHPLLRNHGLLSLNAQPTWKVVAGGSHTYIPKLTANGGRPRPRGRLDSTR